MMNLVNNKKLEVNERYKYYVIEFMQLPYVNIANYVIVPDSWIKRRRAAEGRALVAYPNEDPETTKARVAKNETYRSNWNLYLAFIKYVSDDFIDADNWVTQMIDADSREKGCPEIETNYYELPNGAENKTATESNNVFMKIGCSNTITSESQSAPGTERVTAMQNISPTYNINRPREKKENKLLASIQLSHTPSNPFDPRKEIYNKSIPNVKTSNHSGQASNHSSMSLESRTHKQWISMYRDYTKQDYFNLQDTDVEICTSQSNTNNIRSATQISFNCPDQSNQTTPISLPRHHMSVVSDDYLFHDSRNRENIESSKELYRSSFQSSQHNTSATEALCILNQQSHIAQSIYTNPVLVVNKKDLNQEPLRHELPDIRSNEVNYMGQKICPRDVTKSTLSDLLTSSDPLSHYRLLTKRSHDIQEPPSHLHSSQYVSRTNEVTFSDNTGIKYIHQKEPTYNVTKNIHFVGQNVCKVPNQPQTLSEKPHETQYSVDVQCSHQQQYQSQSIIKTTGENIKRLTANPEKNTENTRSAVQEYSTQKNQTYELTRHENENYTSTALPKYLQHGLCTQRLMAGGSTTVDHVDQNTRNKKTSKNIPRATQNIVNRSNQLSDSTTILDGFGQQNTNMMYEATSVNQPHHISKDLHENPYTTLYKNGALRDPNVQEILLLRPINFDSHDVGSYSLKISENIPSVIVQHDSSQDLRTYERIHGRPINKTNCMTGKEYLKVGINKTDDVVGTLANTANNSFEHMRNEQFSQNSEDNLDKRSYTHEIHDRKDIDQSCKEQSVYPESNTGNNPVAIQNSQNMTNQMFKSSNEEIFLADFSDEDASTDEITIEEQFNDAQHNRQINRPKHDTESSRSTIIPSTSNAENKSLTAREIAEQALLKKFIVFFKNMDSSISETYATFEGLRDTFVDYAQTFQKLMEKVNDYCEIGIRQANKSASQKMTGTKDVEKLSCFNDKDDNNHADAAENVDNDPDYSDDDDFIYNDYNGEVSDEDYEPRTKKRVRKGWSVRQKHSFTLPPDYDPKDSKWTLKYKEASPELVELKPHSQVFVNEYKLEYFKRIATNYGWLAQKLMTEIFSLNALSVCSFTGAKTSNCRELIRPGLDQKARKTLLWFLEKFGKHKRWSKMDMQSVVNVCRSKIQSQRAKHRKQPVF